MLPLWLLRAPTAQQVHLPHPWAAGYMSPLPIPPWWLLEPRKDRGGGQSGSRSQAEVPGLGGLAGQTGVREGPKLRLCCPCQTEPARENREMKVCASLRAGLSDPGSCSWEPAASQATPAPFWSLQVWQEGRGSSPSLGQGLVGTSYLGAPPPVWRACAAQRQSWRTARPGLTARCCWRGCRWAPGRH